MATNLINARPGTVIQQSKLLDQYAEGFDDLGGGILPSFPVLSIRGGKWRIKYHGEEALVTDDRGYPKPDIEVVLIMAPRHKSKAYYPEGYQEDNPSVPPVCWSSDGKVPDATVENPINDVCATCEMDKIGSAVTAAGKKTKACGDHKRMVIVPAGDIANEAFGGAMLLRVPASSLKSLQAYGNYLKGHRVLYFGCVTTLTFDPDPSFPKVQFDYARPLEDDEVKQILEYRAGDQVKHILNEEIAATDPTTAEAIEDEGDDTPESKQPEVVQPQPQPTAKPVHTAPAPAARVVPATPAKPAQTPSAQATARPVGGFQTKPAAPAAPIPTPQKTGGFGGARTTASVSTINAAVAKPATPPVSTRQVVQPQEEVQNLGQEPDELTEMFGNLVKS